MQFDESRKYYVYVWYYVENEKVFYVGKGTNYRYRSRKRDNSKLVEIINSCNCDSKIIKDELTEKEAFDFEMEAIEFYRDNGHPLINILPGGHLPPNHSGAIRSKETLVKMSESMRKYYASNPEMRVQLSERFRKFLATKAGDEFQEKSLSARMTEQFRKEQSERSRRANNTDEYKRRQSGIVKRMWESDEYRNSHVGKNNGAARSVKQFDLNHLLVAEYDTMTEAEKATGVSVSKISAVARGVRKTAGGYVWAYATDAPIRHVASTRTYCVDDDRLAMAILQFDKLGNFVAEYKSIAEATRVNNFNNRTNIICNLKGKTKSAYGYVWKYKHGNTVPSQDC